MLPYLIILLGLGSFSMIEAYTRKNSNKYILHLYLFVYLSVFVSASISRGDYSSYINIFRNIDFSHLNAVFEPVFYYMLVAIKYINLNENFLFLISASLAILIKYRALFTLKKNHQININYSFFFLIYCALFLTYFELGSIRFGIASAFFLWASTFLNNNSRKYLIIITIGSLFHTSLLVTLVIPFILRRKPLLVFTLLFFTGCLLSYLLKNAAFISFISSNLFLSKIINYSRFGSITITAQLIKKILILSMFFLVFKKEISNKNSYIYSIWSLSVFGLGLYFLFASNQLIASRYLLLFSVIEPIMIILLFHKFNKISKALLVLPILIMMLFVNFSSTLYRNNNVVNVYLPYKNFLLGDEQVFGDPEELKRLVEEGTH